MKLTPGIHRHNEIQRIKEGLEQDGFPRLQMLLLVALTGASGFMASYILLHAGLAEMWLRYLASFGIAYLAFLTLLWLWLRTRAEDYAGLDLSGVPTPRSGSSGTCYGGKGGEFGGGGASGSFEAPTGNVPMIENSSDSFSDAIGSAAEAEEFAIPLALIVLAGAVLVSSLFMIYSAPALFAELLVDGVLSATLYRRLRGFETRHWLETAVRRTAWPFLAAALIASASGWGMKLYAPEAKTIRDVVLHSNEER